MRVWIISLTFYICVYAFCELLRYIVRKFVDRSSYLYTVLYEFIGTLQICAPMFDVNFVLGNYGLRGVLIEITFIEIMNTVFQREAIADPCPLIMSWIKGSSSTNRLLSILLTQFAAAYCSFIVAKTFWGLGLHPLHLENLSAEHCEADLTVAILYGSMVEAIGTFTGKLSEFILEDRIVNAKIFTVIQSFIAGLITILGISLTGMYGVSVFIAFYKIKRNPIVAWACTFNCGDVPHITHFVVYWIAPLIAWHIADRYLYYEEVQEKKEQ